MPYAVHIDRYGPPEVLTWGLVELTRLGQTEVRVRTQFAAVNHTDLHIRAGDWPIGKELPFPYVPGVEVVGTVHEIGSAVHQWQPGQTVITMMQGLGGVRAERPGAYSEFVIVDADALAEIPGDVSASEMAALGLSAVTAYEGLRRLGPLSGKRVIVTGAAGGVGSSATAIARAQGASVLAIIRRSADADYARSMGASEVIVANGAETALEPGIADGVLDVVAGDLFGPCVKALKVNGVLCLVGAVANSNVSFDAWELICPVTLTGYSTESLDGASLRQAVSALADLLRKGLIKAPDHRVFRLPEASRAHRMLEERQVRGRVLLAV